MVGSDNDLLRELFETTVARNQGAPMSAEAARDNLARLALGRRVQCDQTGKAGLIRSPWAAGDQRIIAQL